MDVATNTQVPRPRDGRAELAALALAIAAGAQRRDEPGADESRPAAEPDHAASQPRAMRSVVATAIAGVGVAFASLAVAPFGHHQSGIHPVRHSEATRTNAAPTQAVSDPAATLGASAARRLSTGGRPVTSYGCESAYTADAAAFPAVLPASSVDSTARAAYMRACLSGMS